MIFATLDGQELPCHFHYVPLVGEKRVSYKKTAAGIVSQRSDPLIIHQGEIPFSLVGFGDQPSQDIWDAFNNPLPLEFTGYYGEEHTVEIKSLSVEVRGGIYHISGIMQVLCTAVPFQPSCLS